MICYVFFVSKSHSATLFRSNVCDLAEVVSFNTFMFYRYLTSPRSGFILYHREKYITNDNDSPRSVLKCPQTPRPQRGRIFIGCLSDVYSDLGEVE